MNEEDKYKKRAIWKFMANRTLPILLYRDNKLIDSATGHLYIRGDELYLTTARHFLAEWDENNELAVPARGSNGDFVSIPSGSIKRPKDNEIDVAAVRIDDNDMKSALLENWEAIEAEDIGRSSTDGTYFLFGFPVQRRKPIGERVLRDKPLALYVERKESSPVEPIQTGGKNPHIFFDLPRYAEDENGEQFEVPDLRGMSGCCIWKVEQLAPDKVWAARKALKAVAVQCAALSGTGGYIHGIKWGFLGGLIYPE